MAVTGLTPISAGALAHFEARNGLTLPEDYRSFLLVHGSGSPEPNCYLDPTSGSRYFLALIFDPGQGSMADQCFPFPPPADTGFLTVGTNAGGDYFLVSLATGAVYYWDHELHDVEIDPDELLWLAPSLAALVTWLSSAPDIDVGLLS